MASKPSRVKPKPSVPTPSLLKSWIAWLHRKRKPTGLEKSFVVPHGVQKCLALPPGITVFCASAEYVERAESRPRRSFTLDPVRTLRGHIERKTPATPSISHYFALARQLADIGREGWDARFERHARMQAGTLAWARRHGLEPFPDEPALSPTVSCLRGGALDVARLIAGLKRRGLAISNGYGDLKGLTFRIGHMGDHTEQGLAELLAAADEVLAEG